MVHPRISEIEIARQREEHDRAIADVQCDAVGEDELRTDREIGTDTGFGCITALFLAQGFLVEPKEACLESARGLVAGVDHAVEECDGMRAEEDQSAPQVEMATEDAA